MKRQDISEFTRLMRAVIAAMFVLALLGFTLGRSSSKAHAHEDGAQHYPIECCHQMDCAPVEKVEIIPSAKFAAAGMGYFPNLRLPSQTVVTTKHGTAAVPENFDPKAIYESQDGRAHACIRCTPMGSCRLICLFNPPSL